MKLKFLRKDGRVVEYELDDSWIWGIVAMIAGLLAFTSLSAQ